MGKCPGEDKCKHYSGERRGGVCKVVIPKGRAFRGDQVLLRDKFYPTCETAVAEGLCTWGQPEPEETP